ncbi:MAG: hypothetical protein IPJ82_24220 [Lewinellaceae bacterium]|nr:hypothetical protein [Lewinellaceae bacterium]
MNRFFVLFVYCTFFCPLLLHSQQKKALRHEDVQRWRKIEQKRISNDGQWVVWVQTPVAEGDPTLHLWSAASGKTTVFPRATEGFFSRQQNAGFQDKTGA